MTLVFGGVTVPMGGLRGADGGVDLGWSFFGPLINAAVSGMRSFTDAELATVRRFLGVMIDIAAARRPAPVTQPGGQLLP